MHRKGAAFQKQRVLAAWPAPAVRDQRAQGEFCVTAQVQSVVSKLLPPALRYTWHGFHVFHPVCLL